jgi:hypothetical protein
MKCPKRLYMECMWVGVIPLLPLSAFMEGVREKQVPTFSDLLASVQLRLSISELHCSRVEQYGV